MKYRQIAAAASMLCAIASTAVAQTVVHHRAFLQSAVGVEHLGVEIGLQQPAHRLHTGRGDTEHGQTDGVLGGRRRSTRGAA